MQSTNIDLMIAKLIRDMRIADSSYLADFHEWIVEAMGLLRTRMESQPAYAKVKIEYHVGHLPCGLLDLEAVEYCGTRLRHYAGLRAPEMLPTSPGVDTNVWTTETTETDMPSGPVQDLKVVKQMAYNNDERYRLYLGHIQTTFADGEVIIYFRKYVTDDRGLPLLPDNADYREACYWWSRAKLIQSGYTDPVYGYDDRIAIERFEKHAARAIGQITYPSTDEKENQIAGQVYFVPPEDYYDSFFNTKLKEPPYDMTEQQQFVKLNSVTLNNGKNPGA